MKLTFICPTFDASGYAEAVRSIIFGLLERGFSIRIIPKDWSQLEAGLPAAQYEKLLGLCGSEIFPDGPIIQMREAQDFQPFPGRVNIGFTMLECDRIPEHWVEKCNQMDQVWVPSTFNEKTFFNSGVRKEKIKVCPLGVNVHRFHPAVAPMPLPYSRDRFVFLSNFEWIPRKGYDLLLHAYLEEFTREDNVALVIKTYDGSNYDPTGERMHRAWKKMVMNLGIKQPPAMHLITAGMRSEEIPSFYTAGDCYIIPTRGEGWNLPVLEAMASGIPVITTNWSAHLDFVNKENGYLIQVDRLEEIPDYGIENDSIYCGARWAVPSLVDIRKWIRYAFEHSQENREKGQLARNDVVHHWSTAKMIGRFVDLLGSERGDQRQ